MLNKALRLPARLLHPGAAGDAAGAGGRHIVSNVTVQLATRVVGMAISLIAASLTARTLGAGGYGVLIGMTAYVGLFAALTDLGFSITAMQRMAAEPEREAEWLGAVAGARCALGVVMAIFCLLSIPLFLSNAHGEHIVGAIITATILLTGPQTLMSVFQARLRSGLMLFFALLQGGLWLAAVLVLASAGGSVAAFSAANVAVLAVIAALQVTITRRSVRIAWRDGLRLWRPMIRLALPMGLASVLITIYYQIDSVLLLQIAGPMEAGIYGAAYRFLAPLSFLPAAVMSSFFPVLSAIHQQHPERARRLIQICADFMAVISLPILGGTIALSQPIVALLYGAEYQRAAGVLPILMIALVALCFGTLAGSLAPVLGLQWRLAAFAGAGAVSNVVLNLLLIPSYGAFGSAWATVATETLTMALMLGTCLVTLRLRLAAGRLLRVGLLSAAMTGVMVLAAPLGLLASGALGALLYVGGLFVLDIVDTDELRRMRGAGN